MDEPLMFNGTPCIEAPGSDNGKGYKRKCGTYAHRWAWINEHGDIPADLVVDHKCRNRACINLEHLQLVSNKENILLGTSPSAFNAVKTHCVRGHELTPDNCYPRVPSCPSARRCRLCIKIRNDAMLLTKRLKKEVLLDQR